MADPAERSTTLGRVLAEVEDEARAQRASGTLPPGFEGELQSLFDELSPQGTASGSLLRQSLQVVDERAGVDLRAPVESSKPGLSVIKRVIAKAIGWYVRFLAAQSARFAAAVARSLHVVADELDQLRTQMAASHPQLPADLDTGDPTSGRWWHQAAGDALDGVRGRVLVSGTGVLADTLTRRGIDAFAPGSSTISGEAAVAELESTASGSLGGVVFDGPVQWLGAPGCERLVALAADRLGPGGVVVVASATPEAWARTASPVLADLAPGRPLHPETWVHLLGQGGFTGVAVTRGGRDRRQEAAEALDGAGGMLRVLDLLVGGPDEYVVTAVSGR